jgi:hypothetical protein
MSASLETQQGERRLSSYANIALATALALAAASAAFSEGRNSGAARSEGDLWDSQHVLCGTRHDRGFTKGFAAYRSDPDLRDKGPFIGGEDWPCTESPSE